MTKPLKPRLIRPSKDGQEGEWAYLFEAKGQDYIFPAQVDELGQLRSLFGEDEARAVTSPREPPDPTRASKVIYWKASEWETKLLPKAVEWVSKHGFAFPDVPYPHMEFRKIEDRGGDERVTEVTNVSTLPAGGWPAPTILVYQFTEVGGEEGKGRKPLLQWWMEGFIELKGQDVEARCYSVPQLCERLADWSRVPAFLKRKIEKEGVAETFRILSVHGASDHPGPREEALRAITMWIAFCRYITSLKTTYEEGLPRKGRRRSEARTTEEALALEQATIVKTVGVLKSGARTKPVNTGTGTKHRYRYLVRGHERIINGRSIWIKPQVRGEGEFLARSVGTEGAAEAAKEIEPPMEVTVQTDASQEAEETTGREEPTVQVTFGDGSTVELTNNEVKEAVEAMTPAAVSEEDVREIERQVEEPHVDADGAEVKPKAPVMREWRPLHHAATDGNRLPGEPVTTSAAPVVATASTEAASPEWPAETRSEGARPPLPKPQKASQWISKVIDYLVSIFR